MSSFGSWACGVLGGGASVPVRGCVGVESSWTAAWAWSLGSSGAAGARVDPPQRVNMTMVATACVKRILPARMLTPAMVSDLPGGRVGYDHLPPIADGCYSEAALGDTALSSLGLQSRQRKLCPASALWRKRCVGCDCGAGLAHGAVLMASVSIPASALKAKFAAKSRAPLRGTTRPLELRPAADPRSHSCIGAAGRVGRCTDPARSAPVASKHARITRVGSHDSLDGP